MWTVSIFQKKKKKKGKEQKQKNNSNSYNNKKQVFRSFVGSKYLIFNVCFLHRWFNITPTTWFLNNKGEEKKRHLGRKENTQEHKCGLLKEREVFKWSYSGYIFKIVVSPKNLQGCWIHFNFRIFSVPLKILLIIIWPQFYLKQRCQLNTVHCSLYPTPYFYDPNALACWLVLSLRLDDNLPTSDFRSISVALFNSWEM